MYSLRSLNVGPRLIGSFAVVVGLLLAAALAEGQLTKWRLASVQADGARTVQTQSLLAQWETAIQASHLRSEAIAHTSDPAMAELLTPALTSARAQIDKVRNEATALLVSPDEKILLVKVQDSNEVYTQAQASALELKRAGGGAPIPTQWAETVQPAAKQYTDAVQAVSIASKKALTESVDNSLAAAETLRLAILAAMAVTLVLAMAFARSVAQSITQPLARALDALEQLKTGNLTFQAVDAFNDAPGRLLRQIGQTAQALNALVGEVAQAASVVSGAAQEIAQGTQNLSARTEAQAASLEESAAAIEEVSANVQSNANNCVVANKKAAEANMVGTQAREAVVGVADSMQRIHVSSEKINEVISLIDSIAFQTNILALNAAVEAAHAGDQGRGFAVVATEVRTLAGRSAQAAREIKDIVAGTLKLVSMGTSQSQAAGTVMGSVSTIVAEMRGLMDAIALSSKEQAIGLAEVTQSICTLDEATQQNSALVEESAAAAASLQESANRLDRLTRKFTLE